ncbi:MAG: hypothetical protein GY777_07970 [Candidatus Brocadiaceae bacterium]|nr:hypothetical protein [Candidatus Brocadiaceae bacterium]
MMNNKNFEILLSKAKTKIDKTFALVEASLSKIEKYELNYTYSYDELEPFDALTDRFIRCVEMFAKYFKTYDSYKSIAQAPTYRDLINVMEKLGMVANTPVWMDMRDVRNRIVHDYLPEQTKDMFDSIMGKFYDQLKFSKNKIDRLNDGSD